jgi:16S rRNA (cytosine967-C5)-methyltransferase
VTPQARVQAAIELLDEIIAAAAGQGAAADTLIARYFKTRRYAGSKDRRGVRDLIYAAIRRAGERPVSGRAAMVGLARERADLAPLFDGSTHGPSPILPDEPDAARGVAPAWLVKRLALTVPVADMPALLERAPLDLRVNRLKAERDAILARFADAEATPFAPDGLRLAEGIQIEQTSAWSEGLIEIQDEGSQLTALATGAEAGMTVVDLCAGAGGKSLALAAMMGNKGRIIACDVDRARLSRLAPRAERAGVGIIENRLLNPDREMEALGDLRARADIVLVDAPCSGTGTWRRNPEARWRLMPERLARLTGLQARLLDMAAGLVRPGGALIYVVCSLLAEEGLNQIDRFLTKYKDWSAHDPDLPAGQEAGHGLLLTPAQSGTDGFFVARLAAPC